MEQTVQFKNPLISSQELVRFREKTNEFQRGEVSEDEFTAFRLQHGVYGQRQDDVYMIRIKLPAGRLTRAQLKRIGELHQHYALTDIASITTRQDIQLHFVPLKDVPAVLEGLAAVGLTTREACGNTVRNISACPMAGVCPSEHTDVLPLVDETARHFLRHPLTQHLPRKVKMSFSGCEQDCAQGRIHDIAVVAVHDVAKGHGFRLLAGGGLGHKPHDAIVIEPFLLKEDLLAGIEALITVHHRHSDRTKRAKSRIKFLVDRFGEEELRRMYQEEFPRVKSALKEKSQQAIFWFKRDSSDSTSYSHLGAPRKTTKQRQPNQYAVPVSIPLGDLNAEQIFKLVNVMDQFGLDELKATQDQNLIVNNVREDQMSNFKNALVANQFSLPKSGDDVVSCPGTWTCRLGITSSREISKRINTGDLDLRVRVSGCHNGCAQPYVGDIGLHGEGKRLHGKLVPHYQIHLGGNGLATGQIAIKGPYIPVARINRAIKLVQETYRADHAEKENFSTWVHRKGQAFFTELLSELTVVTPDDLPYVLKDVGEEQDFRVLQLGGGECAGIAQETLAAILAEIKNEQKYRD
ncbi:MAG: nitrite/sulfite reductase, partial [Gammaproteobacteria bacterium]|nr:nitrite/sulfite reductase [Gammaproteobacteria bacterium]